MSRRVDFIGQTKTIAAATVQTLTWTSTEVPGERVVAYHIAMTGTNTLADITRIRISANGAQIINVTPEQLRAYLQSYLPKTSDLLLATTDNTFTIPLAMLDAPNPDMADMSQFPVRSQVQVEIITANTTGAGAAYLGWTETDVEAAWFPRILGSAMNIGTSVANQRFTFQENGIVRGFHTQHTGVDRLRFVLGDEVSHTVPGPQYLGVATGNMLRESEELYGNRGTLTTSAFSRVSLGKSAPSAGSYIELTTGAAWVGVANELALYALVPNGSEIQG